MYIFNNILYPLLVPIRLLTYLSVATISIFLPNPLFESFFKYGNLLILLSLGIYPNKIIDKRQNQFKTKIIVFQHRSFADCFIINYIFGPIGYVFRNIFKDNIIIKSYIEKYGGVDVSSNGNEGKTKLITEYIEKNNRKLAIAPEDITDYKTRIVSNNKLGDFKSGAFVSNAAIQPVCIKYYDNDVIWKNYDNGFEKIGYWTIKQLFKPLTYIDIYLLEECHPLNDVNVQQYKDSVRNKMIEVVKNF